ncbi:hypothetical protein TVAG_163600 [Trichomonas vaginalis G3]|uniref:Uncharacterized protein n=1 Tax=Trichomonas vaginalis (strain ATCC PRA-98 / G3) TaxID=412133 RepID=A2DG37_TRIV3|nr:hypothetical protein TVAGG3_0953620 [Trichomonas vaginalis G3]EAY20664.1 hypothetical protein TVAG_163600 [Trichomonas vaginalis G3]KAI5487385.1 hypothetical protein TVAGG3_0953620 [Trichomonas vaginalis G3]|eukprot:XP_001581650.1 hypothetical protein [Trichomonas vaginalis G3]
MNVDANQWVTFEKEVDKDINKINKMIFSMFNGSRGKTPRTPRNSSEHRAPRNRALSPNYQRSFPQKTIQMRIAELRQADPDVPYTNYTKFPLRPNASARIWRPRSIPGLDIPARTNPAVITSENFQRNGSSPTMYATTHN